MIALAMMQSVIMRSDVDVRAEAVIDPLTGMLNRKALHVRVEELRQQSAITGEPVGLIVADLDHFKAINDTYGHAAGDAVLKDVAYALRKDAARLRPRATASAARSSSCCCRARSCTTPTRLAEDLREAVPRPPSATATRSR